MTDELKALIRNHRADLLISYHEDALGFESGQVMDRMGDLAKAMAERDLLTKENTELRNQVKHYTTMLSAMEGNA